MSDGPSTRNRRITKTCFRTCSTCKSHSQAPLYFYTLRTITNRTEGTFVSLRYTLGGDRPSQTTRLPLSPRIHSAGLESNCNKGGISPMAPQCPQAPLHSLPPILRILQPNPIVSYSKGSWGLSVQVRVTGVFTGTTISPSSRSRQRPDRYTIRAGRNYPTRNFATLGPL